MILIGANLKTSSSYPSFSGNDKKNITENTEKNNEKKNQIFSSDMANAIKSQIGIQSPIAYSFLGQYKIDNAGTVSLYKLANGQRVAILPKKGPTVIKSYFNVGSMNEPDDIRGVSHFVEHMAFNGTKNLGAGDFFKITNDMGAMTNASTSFSVTDYYISSQLLDKNDLEESIRIQSEMLQNPKYAPEMIEKEKGPVTSEISMVADSPENVALNNCIKNLFQIETSSPDLVAGRISNIQNMTRDKAYEYYNTWYTPDNCVTVITGEVAPQKAIDLIAKYFNSTKKGTPQLRKYEEFNPITQPVRKDVRMQNAQSTTVAIGLKGPVNASNKEYITMQLLLLCLLGNKTSRISTQLDKIQTAATFSVERMGNRPQDPKAMFIMGQSTPEKAELLIKTIYDEINKLKTNPITEEELEAAKNALQMGFSNLCENSQLLNGLIATSLLNHDQNLDYAQNYLNILKSITTQDIKNFASEFFDLNKASLSVVHPQRINDRTMNEFYKAANSGNKNISFKGNIEDKTFDIKKIKQYRLANNLQVTFNPNSADLSSINITFDTKIPGVTKPAVPALFTIMLNAGTLTQNHKSFFTEPNKRGMELKFSSNFNSISAQINSLSKDTSYSLDLAKEVFMRPRFTEKTLNYAKKFLKESLLNTQETAADALLKEMFPNSAQFATKNELLSSIETISLNDIIAFYNYIMQNSQANATITAPITLNPNIIKESISKLSVDFPMFKPQKVLHFNSYQPVSMPKIILNNEERNQADIVKAYKFKTNYNPKDHLTISLLNTILGDGPYSRLFNDLREKQKLAYRVESTVDYNGNTGILALGIKTTTDNKAEGIIAYDNVQKSLDGFDKHINMLVTQKVTDEELNAAKKRLKTKILNAIESSAGQTNVLTNSQNSCFSIATTAESLKLIDKITADDIHNAANYIFKSNPITSILASKDTLANFS